MAYFAYQAATPGAPATLVDNKLMPKAAPLENTQLGEEASPSYRYKRDYSQYIAEINSEGAITGQTALPPVDTTGKLSIPVKVLSPAFGTSLKQQTAIPKPPSMKSLPSLPGSSNISRSITIDDAALTNLFEQWKIKPSLAVELTVSVTTAPPPTTAISAPVGSAAATPTLITAENILVGAGEILYAVSTTGADSDVGSTITVRLVGMAIGEVYLLGTYSLAGNYLDIRFNLMRVVGYPSFKISAAALDLHTLTPANRTSIERRWGQRYIMPFFASLIGGVGEAWSKGRTTTSITNGQQTTVEERNLSVGDRFIVGAGVASVALAQDLRTEAARIRQRVQFAVSKGLAVQFLADVKDPRK